MAAGSLTINSDLGVNNLFTVTAVSKTIFGSGNISIRSAAAFTAAIDVVPAGANIRLQRQRALHDREIYPNAAQMAIPFFECGIGNAKLSIVVDGWPAGWFRRFNRLRHVDHGRGRPAEF